MSLISQTLHWLQSDEAAIWLQPLSAAPPDDASLLSTLTRLRKVLSADRASAIVSTARLRKRGEEKFGVRARSMFFSEKALQQASPWSVARYTARRFSSFAWVADLGCGLGGDSLALAEEGPQVLAIDRDRLAAELARANARALKFASHIHVIQADLTAASWRLPAAWADPGRRDGDRRIFHPEALQPPLSALLRLQARRTPHMGIKLMPGLKHSDIPPAAEAEWISLNGKLKEAVLWLGDLVQRPARRATLLPAGLSLWAQGERAAVRPPGAILYEPDPAVIRAGAVGDLAQMLGLWQIDSSIAYLSGDAWIKSPFARAWRIIEHFPFDLKGLNRRLRVLQARVVAVKKRGSPIEPEPFRKRLYRRPDGRPVIVVLTRVINKPWMLICDAP